jgi:hypothetical protein
MSGDPIGVTARPCGQLSLRCATWADPVEMPCFLVGTAAGAVADFSRLRVRDNVRAPDDGVDRSWANLRTRPW